MNQARFLAVVKSYSGIADNGNIMAETDWAKRKVVSVGMGLVRKGLLEYAGDIQSVGFEGGIWSLVKSKKNPA